MTEKYTLMYRLMLSKCDITQCWLWQSIIFHFSTSHWLEDRRDICSVSSYANKMHLILAGNKTHCWLWRSIVFFFSLSQGLQWLDDRSKLYSGVLVCFMADTSEHRHTQCAMSILRLPLSTIFPTIAVYKLTLHGWGPYPCNRWGAGMRVK